MDSKEVLGKMFSSFLDRKNRSPTARAHFGSHEPPLTSRSFHNASASNMPFVLHEHIKPPFQSPHIQNIVSADHSKSFPRQRGEKRSHASKSGSSRSGDEKHPNSDNNEWMAQKSRREKTGSRMSSSVRDNSGAGSNSKSLQKHAAERQRAGPSNRVESSVIPGRRSSESVDAIAVDSTSVPTPFHCEKCSKAFRQRSQLSRHFLRVHERKKPFACAHCDKSFASAFDRKRHVEVSLHPPAEQNAITCDYQYNLTYIFLFLAGGTRSSMY